MLGRPGKKVLRLLSGKRRGKKLSQKFTMDVYLTEPRMRMDIIDGIHVRYHFVVDEITGSSRKKEHGYHQAPPDFMQK
jgi:hypothetical protein